jgi:hypothetical protein
MKRKIEKFITVDFQTNLLKTKEKENTLFMTKKLVLRINRIHKIFVCVSFLFC